LIDADISHTIARLAKLAVVLVVLYGAAHRLRFNFTTPAIIIIVLCGVGAVIVDFDGDGLNIPSEIQHDTSIFASDSDSDGIPDGYEVNTLHTDPANVDTDSDKISDFDEVNKYKTNPLSENSDGDLYGDYQEIFKFGTDPNSRTVSKLIVKTSPVSGNIFIDGEFQGNGQISTELKPGTYKVQYGNVNNYHSPQSQLVTLKFGQQMNIVGNYESYSPSKLVISGTVSNMSGVSPAVYGYYVNNKKQFFQVTIANNGESSAENVILSTRIEGGNWVSESINEISPNKVSKIGVTPKIPEEVFKKAGKESTKNLYLKLEYSSSGTKQPVVESTVSLKVYGKNALPLADTSRLASADAGISLKSFYSYYIDPHDPNVRFIAANATMGNDDDLEKAKLIFDALGQYGVYYISDPNDPLGTGIDYIQTPSETLSLKGGDCDDLAVLYASALESVGVDTALIHIPGHVFVAFKVDGSWNLIETTMIKAPEITDGYEISYFDQATSSGYDTYTENANSALIVMTEEAWEQGITS
jgi:hypothetical protein